MTTNLAAQRLDRARPALVDPHPDTPVFARALVRPAVPDSQIPVFDDACWQLSLLDEKATAVSVPVIWELFPPVFMPTFKRAVWALINIPTPAVISARLGSSVRARLRPSSLNHTIRAWKSFAHWLAARGISLLSTVDRGMLADYAIKLRDDGHRRDYCQRQLLALTRLWAYAPHLLPCDRIARPPWDDDNADDYLAAPATDTAGDNARIPIHPTTMSPLLVWALRFVTDFAEDILAARQHSRQLQANIRAQARPGGMGDVRNYLADLRRRGEPIPGLAQSSRHARAISARRRRPPRPTVNVRYIAGVLGVTTYQVKHVIARQPRLVEDLPIGDGSPLDLRPSGQVNGRPWLDSIEFDDASVLTMHLATACLLTVGYLSGMRPEEVLHLRRGCCRTDNQTPGGVVRYRVSGHHFKGVNDEDGNQLGAGAIRDQPWTVIAPVAAAIAVLERIEDDALLLPRRIGTVLLRPRARAIHRGDALTPTFAATRIDKFINYANQLAARHGLGHEMIPEDPYGPINLSRLRRTVAWFINRLPGGRVALGIQYGHLRLTMSESYSNRSRSDLLELLDLEQARSIADTLAEAADRLHHGEGVSGPATDRYLASVHEFSTTYAGSHLSTRQHRALLANPTLKVFDHPHAFLACNYSPVTALCDPERGKPGRTSTTPSHDRCDRACANIARTDTHIASAQAEVDRLHEEIASGADPHPIHQRLLARRAALQTIIDAHHTTRITIGDNGSRDE